MRALGVLLLSFGLGACTWGRLRAGSTPDGVVVPVSSTDPRAARRQALESVLPMFLPPYDLKARSAVLDEKVFARPDRFVGREKLGGLQGSLVEVRLDALAAVLEDAGLMRPAGFAAGADRVLLAISESDGGYGIGPAADSMRRALLARSIAAADARDPLNPVKFKAKTADEAVAEASAGGVDWLVLGRTAAGVEPDAQAGAWRAAARLDGELYALKGSTLPVAVPAQASAVDVSSAAALGRALEAAGAEVAAGVAARLEKGRSGLLEYQVFFLPPREAARIRRLVETLRGVEGVVAASLRVWRGPEDAAVVRVYASGMSAEELAARLLRNDHSLTLAGVEPDERRITLETPMAWGD